MMSSSKSAQIVAVSVPVRDQEAAKDFYVDTLGFELLVDNSWREGMRWIEVAPEDSVTSLMLVSWSESLLPSLYRVIVITTDDIRAIYEELVAKGRSEEHTSELQSRQYLVCRLLLEKKKNLLRQL